MNPAALKANIADLPKGATIIVNTDAFNDRTLQKAGYAANPLEDGSLADYHLHEVALTSMTVGALKGIDGITSREAERSKNFFALGLMSWLYHRPVEGTISFIEQKFARSARDRRREHEGVPRRVELRRDVRGLRRLVRGRPGAARARHLPPDHGQHGARERPDRRVEALRPAALPRRVPDHAGVVDPRGARGRKEFGVVTFQAEDEIARSAPRSARRSAARSASRRRRGRASS